MSSPLRHHSVSRMFLACFAAKTVSRGIMVSFAEREAATDWTERPFSCQDCRHLEMRASGRCMLGRLCVRDARARELDAFFAADPQQAGAYLDHVYFEVRALAAKYASLFEIVGLLDDREPEVRVMAALRLPLTRIKELRHDRDRKVRVACALRLDGADLLAMAEDADEYVRQTVARRLDPPLLAVLLHDESADVRLAVADRVPRHLVGQLLADPDAQVAERAKSRLQDQ